MTPPARARRTRIQIELDAIEASLARTRETTNILLGLAILRDGHAKNLGEAIRIAEDLDQVAKLYPDVAS